MSDDRLWPVSIKGVVFVREKVVLLLNHRAEWELPGGRLEKGETPEACLIRELHEELGCTVDVGELLLAEIVEVIPQKFVLIIAYHCLLLSQTTSFRVSRKPNLSFVICHLSFLLKLPFRETAMNCRLRPPRSPLQQRVLPRSRRASRSKGLLASVIRGFLPQLLHCGALLECASGTPVRDSVPLTRPG